MHQIEYALISSMALLTMVAVTTIPLDFSTIMFGSTASVVGAITLTTLEKIDFNKKIVEILGQILMRGALWICFFIMGLAITPFLTDFFYWKVLEGSGIDKIWVRYFVVCVACFFCQFLQITTPTILKRFNKTINPKEDIKGEDDFKNELDQIKKILKDKGGK